MTGSHIKNQAKMSILILLLFLSSNSAFPQSAKDIGLAVGDNLVLIGGGCYIGGPVGCGVGVGVAVVADFWAFWDDIF